MLDRTKESAPLDEREFTIVRRGYDPEEVKAYLREIEASFIELEGWATRTKARLAIAEERIGQLDEIDQAMIAIFEAKEDVLERARHRADQIEAEAKVQARLDYAGAAADIVTEAREQARRIIEEAAATAGRDPVEAGQPPVTPPTSEGGDSFSDEDPVLIVALPDDEKAQDAAGTRQTRYERQSAGLPSIGDHASFVIGSFERFRRPENG